MAHYRRGHKVPALRPEQRLAVGILTIVAVFAVVAVAAWQPAIFALPGAVAVAALGIFDRLIVTTRARATAAPTPRGADAAWPGGPPGGPGGAADPNAPTTVVPRLASPTGHLAAPAPVEPPPPAAGPSYAAPRPGAGMLGPRPPGGPVPHPGAGPAPKGYDGSPQRPVPAPAPDDVDMATMAIDMRAFLEP